MKTDSPLILVVEDNPADAALIREELNSAVNRGVFDLCHASTMAEAKNHLRERDIDAILLDLSLPDTSGMETFDGVTEQAPDTPVVVLTGLDDGELGLRAVRRGAQDFLVKGKIDAASLERTLHYSVERKRRETDMRQRQSLAVVSQFADGIAHEFNNLLQTVLGHLQALEWPLRNNAELVRELRAASDTVIDGAALTRRLLAITGRLPDEPALLDANTRIAGISDSLRKAFGDTTSIRTDLSDDIWPVFADAARLDMTLLNIVNNAREAMLGYGEVTIRTSNFSIADGNPAKLAAGDYVKIEIVDIGTGVTAADRKRRVEAPDTSRFDARLEGLGLDMTQSFIRSSGGHIGVRDADGQGTAVTIYLPRAEADPASATPAVGLAPPRKAGNVLVLEENRDLRASLTQYLWQLGYPTFEAASADDAFSLLDGADAIELVVVDRDGSSGIAGDLLAKKLRRLSPRVKFLFLTNAECDLNSAHGLSADDAGVLAKPFRMTDMQQSIDRLLQAPGTTA